MIIKQIATHNTQFHADELTAIAILKIFTPNFYEVTRLPHQSPEETLEQYDFVIDIGRKYDHEKRFDHHQWEGGKSSAGLIWEYIGKEDLYPEITELVKKIDDNDVGREPAKVHEYSRLLSCYNYSDTHSPKQRKHFDDALQFAMTIIRSLKNSQDDLNKNIDLIANADKFENISDVLEFDDYIKDWGKIVNGQNMPEIGAVVWPDKKLDTYNIQVTNTEYGSYDKHGPVLLPCNTMNFVHANGFFAVAKNRETMLEYIKNKRS